MTAYYQLAVLGAPTATQLDELHNALSHAIAGSGLRLGYEITWEVLPAAFKPSQLQPAAVVFFGGEVPHLANLQELLQRGIPILPVGDNTEMPAALRPLHCFNYASDGAAGVAAALLACAGLLPRQRKVFISYHQDESAEAASQLFEALTARQFDVFLDHADMQSAADLRTMAWHRLYDADVLLMLDTPAYFESRWTNVEFGRLLAKGISVLRVGWPNTAPARRTLTASRVDLSGSDMEPAAGLLAEHALQRICLKLEEVRSQNHAVRSVNLVSSIRIAMEAIGGRMLAAGAQQAIYLQLPDGRPLVVYPVTGVPTPVLLRQALEAAAAQPMTGIYDHVGLHAKWLARLDWLDEHDSSVRWLKSSEAAWQFAHWES